MVTSRKATINSQRDIKLDMWTPAGYVTIHHFCWVSRSFAGDKRDSQQVTVSPRIQWSIISGPNGIVRPLRMDSSVGLLLIMKLSFKTLSCPSSNHTKKNLCRSSDKHWGLEDDIEDLVSIATNGYGVKTLHIHLIEPLPL